MRCAAFDRRAGQRAARPMASIRAVLSVLSALSALAALGPLAGCSTYVPVVPEAVQCAVPAELRQGCAAPQKLTEGITYGDLLVVYQGERQALKLCGANHEALLQAVAVCEAEVARHNAELKRLDEALKARK